MMSTGVRATTANGARVRGGENARTRMGRGARTDAGGARRALTVVAARRGDKTAGGKNDTKKKNSKNDGKKNSKTLKPPMEGKTTLKIGALSVDVPVALPQSVVDAPRPAVYAASALGLLLAKKVLFGGRRRSKGSLGELEERGMLDENRDVDEEKFYKGMMKQVRTVQMPELTDEQIQAARERRRQSSGGNDDFSKSIASAEIPANHPWAMKETVSREEQEEQERRVLEANRPRQRRRGPPPSD